MAHLNNRSGTNQIDTDLQTEPVVKHLYMLSWLNF